MTVEGQKQIAIKPIEQQPLEQPDALADANGLWISTRAARQGGPTNQTSTGSTALLTATLSHRPSLERIGVSLSGYFEPGQEMVLRSSVECGPSMMARVLYRLDGLYLSLPFHKRSSVTPLSSRALSTSHVQARGMPKAYDR